MKTDYKKGDKVRVLKTDKKSHDSKKGDISTVVSPHPSPKLMLESMGVNCSNEDGHKDIFYFDEIEPYQEYIQGKEYEFSDDGNIWDTREFLCESSGLYWAIHFSSIVQSYPWKHIRPIKVDNTKEIEEKKAQVKKLKKEIKILKKNQS